jgi:hypothetical protein
MSPGFHGRSLLTRQLGKLTHQILRVARAAPVVSMAPNLPRGDIFMTVFTPTATFAVGALRKLDRDRHHDPCYKLMATFHKMKDESGTEIVRRFDQGHAGHVSTQGSRISALRVALVLLAVVLLLLVFIRETASVLTSATSALTGTCHWGRAPAGAVLGDAARVVAGFGRMAQRPTTARRNGKI